MKPDVLLARCESFILFSYRCQGLLSELPKRSPICVAEQPPFSLSHGSRTFGYTRIYYACRDGPVAGWRVERVDSVVPGIEAVCSITSSTVGSTDLTDCQACLQG